MVTHLFVPSTYPVDKVSTSSLQEEMASAVPVSLSVEEIVSAREEVLLHLSAHLLEDRYVPHRQVYAPLHSDPHQIPCVNNPRSVRHQSVQFRLQSDHQIGLLLPEPVHYLAAEFQPVQVLSAFPVKKCMI
jgi:hypothetical protein